MSDLLRFLAEWAHLAWQVVVLLVLETVIGFAVAAAVLPRFFRARWLLAAPLVGMALNSAVVLPLSFAGFSVAQVWWVPLVVASAGAAFVLIRQRGRMRALVLGAKSAGFTMLAAVLIVTCVSSYYLTSRGTGSTRDLWGSSDFFDYWVTADYLQKYSAAYPAYVRQKEFKSGDVERHLALGARLGMIANLATWSRVFSPGDSYRIINAAVVGGMVGWLLVLRLFLDRERVRARWPVLLVALHPMLYCLLFFTYYSQATMLPLSVLTLMLLEQRTRRWREGVATGAILGANFLSYAALAVPFAFAGAISLGRALWKRMPVRSIARVVLLPWLVAITVSSYYLTQPAFELLFVNAQTVQGGWEWRSLVAFPEIFGIAPLAGYFLPLDEPDERLWANIFLGAVALSLLVLAWRGLRQRMLFSAVVGSTVLLLAVALSKVAQGIPNASHGVFKIVSQYGLLIFVIMLIPIATLLRRKIVSWLPVAALAALGAWLWQAWPAVDFGAEQRALFKPEAVAFVREQAQRVPKVCVLFARFGWWRANIPEAILRRKEQIVMKNTKPLFDPAQIEPVAFIYDSELGTPAATLARSEHYRIGTPPSAVNFASRGERMWVQQGVPAFWEKSKRCVLTLGPRGSRLVLGYRWKAVKSEATLSVHVNGESCGEVKIVPGTGEVSVTVKPAANAREPYTIIELELLPAEKPPGNPIVLDRISYAE